MKTMVGREPGCALEFAEFFLSVSFEQAEHSRASTSSGKTKRRKREVINAPLKLKCFLVSQCKPRG
jgi:hypothetical protein